MKVVYLASPFSSRLEDKFDKLYEESERYRNVTLIASKLQEENPDVAFILPITQSFALKKYNDKLGTNFEFWRNIDLEFINRSDEVWVVKLEGWEKSIGVTEEIAYANATNKPVKFIGPRDYIVNYNLL